MAWESGASKDPMDISLPGKVGKANEAVDWAFVGAVVLIIATL